MGNLKPETITGRINLTAIELLAQQPEGLRWAELSAALRAALPELHPKTINGCVWKLAENFPERVERPEKGLFRIVH